jgi:hypothetical protein
MLGKNLGKKSPFAGRKRPRVKKDLPPSDPDMSSMHALDIVAVNGSLVKTSGLAATALSITASSTTVAQLATSLTIPRNFGWDIGPLCFPDAVEPGTVETFLKCTMSSASFLQCH